LNIVLLIVYLVVLAGLMTRVPFAQKSGLGRNVLVVLFLYKILAGFIIGWVSFHFSNSDYWQWNMYGWQEYQLLLQRPGEYFTNLFHSPYPQGYNGFLDSVQSFWNDLKTNLVIKLISIFNIASRGDYYVNSLFFNFIGFFGHLAIYRVFITIYPNRKNAVIIGSFLLPSLLYFSSAVHKDCILLTAMGMACFSFFQAMQTGRFTPKRLFYLGLSLLVLLLLRSFVFLAMLPAFAGWYLAARIHRHPLVGYIVVYAALGLLLVLISVVYPGFDPAATIAEKQGFFLLVKDAHTAIPVSPLQPGWIGLFQNVPEALNHTLFRPYLTEHPIIFMIPIAIELFAYQLLVVLYLLFPVKRIGHVHPMVLFGLFFTIPVLLNIGFIVNNLGAIVRYRSIYLPFLITPVLAGINWPQLRKIIPIAKKNNV
jgi:hypothetical protein